MPQQTNPFSLQIFNSIPAFKTAKRTIVTIGTFDGVHIGHKKIIERLVQSTENGLYETLILTFFPHPRMVLHTKSEIKLLNTMAEKSQLLEKTGLDHLVVHPFDAHFSTLSAEDFVKTVLVDAFGVQKIIIGHDHRFGKDRTAGIDDLIRYGKQYGFEVEQIVAQEINLVSVSSTKIRKAILEGDMALANTYLGYDYLLTGTVTKGKQLGRTIGFPTANITIPEDYKLIPKNGVYAVKSVINNQTIFGMMNIGTNPTVGGESLSIEVNFFDFDADLYSQEIQLTVMQRLRDEQKFASVELLKAQLAADKLTALSLSR